MTTEDREDIKRYFGVVAEGLESKVQQVAEGVAATNERIDRLENEVRRGFSELGSVVKLSFGQLDARLTRVERSAGAPR
jgi:hypothetical protein